MKKLVFAIIAIVALFAADASAQSKKEAPKKKTEKVYYACFMDCASCEQKLGDELRFTKGVKDLKVDYKTQTVFVEYKVGKTDKSKIEAAFKKKEYTPKEITEKEYKTKTTKK